MAMGSTGTVNITPEMMKNALSVIEGYQEKTTGYMKQLDDLVTALIPSEFNGSAARGFRDFYDDNIQSVAADSLSRLLKSLNDIVQGILTAIPDTDGLDDQLGEGNRK